MRECVTYNFPIRDAASGGAHAVEVDLKRLMSAVGNGADGRKGQARFLGASGNSGRFHVNCNCAVLGELLFLGCGNAIRFWETMRPVTKGHQLQWKHM